MYVKFEPKNKYSQKHKRKDDPIDWSENAGYTLSESADGFEDAGYVLEKNDLVVDIDCLSKNQIEALISTFGIETETVWTDRGVHFYFKKPSGFRRARSVTPLGFPVEYKHTGNTKAITVKRNGVMRKIDNAGVREDLPDCLMFGRYEEMLGLEEGDNRNNRLYELKRKISTMPGYKTMLSFINNHIFAEPLNDKEFQSVSREEMFSGGKDQENLVADIIIREHRAVKYAGCVYLYKDGEYTNDEDEIRRIIYSYCPGVKTRYVDEVLKQIDYRCKLEPYGKVFEIKLENGILYEGQFIECDFHGFTPYTIPIPYIKDAEPVKEVDDYLNHLTKGNPDYILRVIEAISHCLVTNKDFIRLLAKFHIFVGNGGNGKGTLLQVIKKILGGNNCSALSIQNMEDERYFNQLHGKLVNLGDDIQDEPINNKQMKLLKNISTADTVEIRKMYHNSNSAEISTTLIFTSNHVLKSFEKGESYKRRVDWLPMFTKPKHKEVDFISKLTSDQALRYWMRLIVEGYFRLYANKQFTSAEPVKEYNEAYHEENNNTILFVADLLDEEIEGKKPPEIYQRYESWCEDNGDNALSKRQLRSTIMEQKGFIVKAVTNNRKTSKVYVKQEQKELNGF